MILLWNSQIPFFFGVAFLILLSVEDIYFLRKRLFWDTRFRQHDAGLEVYF